MAADNTSTGTQEETNSTSTAGGSSGSADESISSDVSLNELSANHNNELFAPTVVAACADALSHQVEMAGSHDLETEQVNNTHNNNNRKAEEREHLLATTSSSNYNNYNLYSGDYHNSQAVDESANLWNKAMTTLAKSKCSKTASSNKNKNDNDEEPADEGPNPNTHLSAYDMGAVLDGSINGGEFPPDSKKKDSPGASPKKRSNHQQIVPSSDYSIDGESAIVWTDDVEQNYFKYMMDQEALHRAQIGKDQDDSLLGGSTREELLNAMATGHQGGGGGGTSTFDEDDTTLGHGSKIFGWDQTVVGASAAGGSSLTPSLFRGATLDKDGQLIIPNVIYVSDGNNNTPVSSFAKQPGGATKSRRWNSNNNSTIKNNKNNKSPANNTEPSTPSSAKSSSKSKKQQHAAAAAAAANKHLDDEDVEVAQPPKSPCHANRILIGAAIFFLLLTTGLVAALIVYRNHYNDSVNNNNTSSSSALGENTNDPGTDLDVPSPADATPSPTLAKKTNDDEFYFDDDEEENDEVEETDIPSEIPTAAPSSVPTETPSNGPSAAPVASPSTTPSTAPSTAPSEAPSSNMPSEAPSTAPSSNMPSEAPTVMQTESATSSEPSAAPSRVALAPPQNNTSPAENNEDTSVPTMAPSVVVTTAEVPSETPTTITASETPSVAPSSHPTTSTSTSPSQVPTTTPTQTQTVVTPEPTAAATVVVTQNPTAMPTTSMPTIATNPPTAAPSSMPPVPSYVAFDTVRNFLIEFSPMSEQDLFNEDSMQFAALVWLQRWMASIRPEFLGSHTKWRIVQRWSLAVIYYSMNGPNWVNNENWLSGMDFCDWLKSNNQGACQNNEVVSLDLSSNSLTGTLPKEISLLSRSLSEYILLSGALLQIVWFAVYSARR